MVMTLPKIGFVTGYQECSIHDMSPQGFNFIAGNKKVQPSVWNQGFDVEEVTLDKPIPDDINILVIGDPRVPYSDENERVLQAYLERGGNLFLLGEPRHREVLNPTLRKLFGVELTPILVQQNARYKVSPEFLICPPTKRGKDCLLYTSDAANDQ